MEFLFIDGEKICVYKDGKVTSYESNYINKYREASLVSMQNSEWKKKSRTEMLMNEDFFYSDEEVYVYLHAVAPTQNENELLYAFSVNDSSGIYLKYLGDEKNTEAHVISSNQVDFTSLFASDKYLLATVKKGEVAADIAVFSADNTEYKSVTSGDSLDENPSFDKDGNILFNSYGVARDENNNFLGYGESEVYRLNLNTMTIEEVFADEGVSYIKPMEWEDTVYCIKRPLHEKQHSNVLMDIVMIPVRIAQGIVGFVSAFVSAFSGKPLLSEGRKSDGGSLLKNYKKDERRLFVMNNFIKVEAELKRNRKERDYGFIPRTWRLVQRKPDPKGQGWLERTIFQGVGDYCLLENGNVVFTNGKHLFLFNGEYIETILDVNCCIKVSPITPKHVSVARTFEEL